MENNAAVNASLQSGFVFLQFELPGADSNEIDELSFRQLVDKGYEVTDYWQDILRFGHKKLWWYIEQCDYNLYYAENKIYTKFSEIGESNET